MSISVLDRTCDLRSFTGDSKRIFQDSNRANGRSKNLGVKKSQVESEMYNCHLCEKTYKHSYALSRHLKSHSGFKPFVCSVCNKAFSRQDSCRKHIFQIHDFQIKWGNFSLLWSIWHFVCVLGDDRKSWVILNNAFIFKKSAYNFYLCTFSGITYLKNNMMKCTAISNTVMKI